MPSRTVAVNLTANPSPFVAGFAKAGAAVEALDAKTLGLHKNLKTLGGAFLGYEVVKGLGDATKAAANFQTQILRLKTDANETGANLASVSKGILNLAGATGNSTTALAAGMYKIESAGIHGADALKVLKAAAEGAKVGQADLTTVSDALTTAMTNYKVPASGATATTNQLIAAVSRGKTTLEDLSAAMGTVLPVASTAKIGLDQVLGSMAVMTSRGLPAANAATYLKQTIVALSNPLPKATAEMQGLGLSAIDVSNNLGQRGITGTLQILADAMNKKLGPAGLVALQTFTKSTGSTKDLAAAFGQLPTKTQTVVAGLADLVGGAKSLQGILELLNRSADGTLSLAPGLATSVKGIGDAGKGAGDHVKDWSDVQKTLNFQLASASGALQKVSITLGQELLPPVTKIVTKFADFAGWLGKYPKVVEGLTFALVGTGGLVLGLKAVNLVMGAYQGLAASSIGWRTRQTAAMVAEAAAARSAAGAVTALDVAEAGGAAGKVGLLGRLGRSTVGTAIGVTALRLAPLGAAAGVAAGGAAVAVGGIYGINRLNDSAANRAEQQRAYQTEILNSHPLTGYGMNGPPGTQNYGPDVAARAAANVGDRADFNGVRLGRAGIGDLRRYQALSGGTQSTYASQVPALAATTAAARAAAAGMQAAAFKASIMQNAFIKAGDGANGLALGLAKLSDDAITASRSQDGFQQQLNNLAASVDKHSKTLVGNSNAAIQNRGLIDELAQANEQAAQAVYKHTGSMDKAKQTLIDNATALEKNAAQAFGSQKAADDFLRTIGALPSQVAAAFVGIHDIGLGVGTDLGAGLVAGITAQVGPVNVAGKLLVSSTIKQMRLAAQTHSPSKVTHKVGTDMGAGLAGGLTSSEKKAAEAAKKLANAALASLKFEVRTGAGEALKALESGISALKKKIGGEQSALANVRSNRASAMSSAKGNITGVADLSAITGTSSSVTNWDGTTTTTQNPVTGSQIKGALDADAQLAMSFVGHLKQLRQAGYSKTLTDQILGMGPAAGDAYATAILSLGAGGVAGINADLTSIDRSGSAAAAAAGKPFDKQTADLIRELKRQNDQLERMSRTKAEVTLTIKGLGAPGADRAVVDAVLAAVNKELGTKVHLRVRTSPTPSAGNSGGGFGGIG